jgi:hypothetical protein
VPGPPCHLEDINIETWSPRLGRLTTLLCKKNYCCEIRRSENQMSNVAEPSMEDCGSKRAVLKIKN